VHLHVIGMALAAALCGCAGPHSPFGSVEMTSGDGDEVTSLKVQRSSTNPMTFAPRRQVLHQPADLSIVVPVESYDDYAKPLDLQVAYNGRNVTHSFLRHAEIEVAAAKQMKLTYRNLRLSASRRHDISFYYRTSDGDAYMASDYLPPVCSVFAQNDIKTTQPFEPKAEYLKLIQKSAKKYDLNPNLLAGLIAQESGFDPDAETWAHAVGLTQITPLAAEEIESVKPGWKKITRRDWRTIPSKSIEGGAIYLQFLNDYWSDADTTQLLLDHNATDMSSIILASYNSGAARVKKDIVDSDEKWLEQPNLKEAFRYVNRVSSYCYHFSGGEE
jgi:Transglycosylase SLT domain